MADVLTPEQRAAARALGEAMAPLSDEEREAVRALLGESASAAA